MVQKEFGCRDLSRLAKEKQDLLLDFFINEGTVTISQFPPKYSVKYLRLENFNFFLPKKLIIWGLCMLTK